jgi:hypothetical protein
MSIPHTSWQSQLKCIPQSLDFFTIAIANESPHALRNMFVMVCSPHPIYARVGQWQMNNLSKISEFLSIKFLCHCFIRFELDAGVLSRYRLLEMQAAESLVKTVVSILSLLYCALWCLFLIYAAFVSLIVCKFLKLASLPVDRWITWRLRGVCIRQKISWHQVCRMLR